MPSYFIGHPFDARSLTLTLQWLYFNEIVHYVLTIVCGLIGYFFTQQGYFNGTFITAFAAVLNVGLALMQRMNRRRIRHTRELLKQRTAM